MSEYEAGLEAETLKAEIDSRLDSIQGQPASFEEMDKLELDFYEYEAYREAVPARIDFLYGKLFASKSELATVCVSAEIAYLSSIEGSYAMAHGLLNKANEAGKKFPMPFSSIVRSRVRALQTLLRFNESNGGKPIDQAMAPADQAASHARKALEEGDQAIVQKEFVRMMLGYSLRLRSYSYLATGNMDKAMEADADERKFGFLQGREIEKRELQIAGGHLKAAQIVGVDDDKIVAGLEEAYTRAGLATFSSDIKIRFGGFAIRKKIPAVFSALHHSLPVSIEEDNVDIRKVIEDASFKERITFEESAEIYFRILGKYGFSAIEIGEVREILKESNE